jgi:hypothetical protein
MHDAYAGKWYRVDVRAEDDEIRQGRHDERLDLVRESASA